jgi:hypothetical protein
LSAPSLPSSRKPQRQSQGYKPIGIKRIEVSRSELEKLPVCEERLPMCQEKSAVSKKRTAMHLMNDARSEKRPEMLA